jgi:hypothetical protein
VAISWALVGESIPAYASADAFESSSSALGRYECCGSVEKGEEAMNPVSTPKKASPRKKPTDQRSAGLTIPAPLLETEQRALSCLILDAESWNLPWDHRFFIDERHRELFRKLEENFHRDGAIPPIESLMVAVDRSKICSPADLLTIVHASEMPGLALATNYHRELSRFAQRRKAAVCFVEGLRELEGDVSPFEVVKRIASEVEELSPLDSVLVELDKRRIDLKQPISRPKASLLIANKPVCTPGNLVVIAAQPKAGKSAFISAMVAAIAAEDEDTGTDCLGVESIATNGKAVLFFDTEQSPYDAQELINRAARRAGLKDMPHNFRAYSIRDLSTAKRREALRLEMNRASREHGGIFAVFLDGVADLIPDVNNIAESGELVDELAALSTAYSCPTICVLHENSRSENGKTRGHLGSQLERKSETNLRIVKSEVNGEAVSEVFSDGLCRHEPITRLDGISFKWCPKAKMHVICQSPSALREEVKRAEVEAEARAVLTEPMAWAEALKKIESELGLGREGARSRFKKWREKGIVQKSPLTDKWGLNP